MDGHSTGIRSSGITLLYSPMRTGIVRMSETLFMSGDGKNIPFSVDASLKAVISAVAVFRLLFRIEIDSATERP
jgi:hypothetical protein